LREKQCPNIRSLREKRHQGRNRPSHRPGEAQSALSPVDEGARGTDLRRRVIPVLDEGGHIVDDLAEQKSVLIDDLVAARSVTGGAMNSRCNARPSALGGLPRTFVCRRRSLFKHSKTWRHFLAGVRS
jgi:hypothetical protein